MLLYRNLDPAFSPSELIDASGPIPSGALLRPLIERVENERREVVGTLGKGAAAETFHALPLNGDQNNLLGVLLIGSSRRDLVELEATMLRTAVLVAITGILMAIVLSWWATARITRPVQRLAESACRVAAGDDPSGGGVPVSGLTVFSQRSCLLSRRAPKRGLYGILPQRNNCAMEGSRSRCSQVSYTTRSADDT